MINLKKESRKSGLKQQLDQKIKENKALSGMLYILVLKPESKQSEEIKAMVKRWATYNEKNNGGNLERHP